VEALDCWMPANGFLYWTHLVEIWWPSPPDQSEGAIIAHEPEPASRGGVCPR
jgi:hypothetical protein